MGLRYAIRLLLRIGFLIQEVLIQIRKNILKTEVAMNGLHFSTSAVDGQETGRQGIWIGNRYFGSSKGQFHYKPERSKLNWYQRAKVAMYTNMYKRMNGQ